MLPRQMRRAIWRAVFRVIRYLPAMTYGDTVRLPTRMRLPVALFKSAPWADPVEV